MKLLSFTWLHSYHIIPDEIGKSSILTFGWGVNIFELDVIITNFDFSFSKVCFDSYDFFVENSSYSHSLIMLCYMLSQNSCWSYIFRGEVFISSADRLIFAENSDWPSSSHILVMKLITYKNYKTYEE